MIPYTKENPSMNQVIDYIKKNFDSKFDISQYKMNFYFYEGKLDFISLSYQIGEYSTYAGYGIHCEDDYIVRINQNNIVDYSISEIVEQENDYTEKQLKEIAIEDSGIGSWIDAEYTEVLEQRIEKMLDIKTNRCYYSVETDYKSKDKGSNFEEYGTTCREYDINAKVIRKDENGNIISEETYVKPPEEKKEEAKPVISTNILLDGKYLIPCTKENLSVKEIEKYIKENIDADFNSSQYKIDSEFYNNNGTVKFQFQIGDFIADSGYTIKSRNGYVVDIIKEGMIDDTIEIKEKKKSQSEEQLKKQAIQDDNLSKRYTVVNQTVEKRIDMETKQCYYLVCTNYENKAADTERQECQKYEIDVEIIKK